MTFFFLAGHAPTRFVADKLISVLMPYVQSRDALDEGLTDLCIGVFGVTLGEVECRISSGEDRRLRDLEVILAIYVSWANKISISGLSKFISSFFWLIDFLSCQVSKKWMSG